MGRGEGWGRDGKGRGMRKGKIREEVRRGGVDKGGKMGEGVGRREWGEIGREEITILT